MNQGACQTLADLFERKASEGLLGVKFFVQGLDETATEEICAEVIALYSSPGEPYDFGDLAWRD